MYTSKPSFWLWQATILFFAMLTFSCKPEPVDPEPEPENRAPGSFMVTATPDMLRADLSWTAPTDPDGDPLTYSVILEGNTLADQLTTTSYALIDLAYETSYSGKVVASDPDGLTSEATFSFTTGQVPNEPPGIPMLTFPEHNASYVDTFLRLTWEPVLDPDGDNVVYDLYLDQNAIPTTVVDTSLRDDRYRLTGLTPETQYYWKVIARDEKGATTESAVFTFSTKAIVSATLIGKAPWPERSGHTALVFDNKMWIIGGNTCCGGRYNDVWSSSDGINWTEVTNNAPWAARTVHTSVVFDGKMWVAAGNASYSQGQEFADVWYSSDGANWTLATNAPAFEPRYGHEMVAYDGKMWIFGGRDVDFTFSQRQIWNSADGINWSLLTDTSYVAVSAVGEMLIHDNKMWYIGGYSDNVYWTTDGLNWNTVTADAAFGQRIQHTCVSHDNRLWLISGADNLISQTTEYPDVWYSEDGTTWVLGAKDAGFVPIAQSQALSFNGKIWLLGGGGGFQSFYVSNEVYTIE